MDSRVNIATLFMIAVNMVIAGADAVVNLLGEDIVKENVFSVAWVMTVGGRGVLMIIIIFPHKVGETLIRQVATTIQ